jgi:hypothetical protein
MAVSHTPSQLHPAEVVDAAYINAGAIESLRRGSDPSIRTNPRMPTIEELAGLLRAGYEGAR